MCGITGFNGNHPAGPILLDGLSKLEYRGYDSAGLAVRDGASPVEIVRAKGRLKTLAEKVDGGMAISGNCGIGHTRWATHGEPSETNAHPHFSDDRNVVAVHNGIIENYQELRDKLTKKGYRFYSDTDTEVAVKLIDYYYKKYEHTPVDAINHSMVRIRGSYALAVMFQDYPDEIYVARKDSPMILGVSGGESYLASDVPAILKYTRHVYYIGNLEIARLGKGEITFYNLDGDEIQKELTEIRWDAEAAEKGGYEHFMMKEIHEQPKAVEDTLNSVLRENHEETTGSAEAMGRTRLYANADVFGTKKNTAGEKAENTDTSERMSLHVNGDADAFGTINETVGETIENTEATGRTHSYVNIDANVFGSKNRTAAGKAEKKSSRRIDLASVGLTDDDMRAISEIHIVACGSAYHVGVVARYVFEDLARVPVRVELASEFRYRNPILDEHALVIIISQSGETADSLAALREAKERGIRTLAIVNVVGSSIAREADSVFLTLAGPEIAVATTKAYSTQLIACYTLAVQMGCVRGLIGESDYETYIDELAALPNKIRKILEDKERLQWFAAKQANKKDIFFIGRGIDYAVSLEGSLKLKEISYIHSEAYAAGELKHGTISLIEDGTLVIGTLTQPELYEKTVSNMVEVKSRGAYLMALTTYGNYEIEELADFVVYIPKADAHFLASLAVIPLQLIGYYVSVAKGLDVDKPRNLAKSVTVE
ncbi:MAG: glutamine--fructose-6-phosphate aminotransferase [Lachnospiraceae bacterium]|nr:glutamine--fructose-6-phosphate aminotransferase [Lachnospiraceae bacterium]